MVELCMTPIIPRALDADGQPTAHKLVASSSLGAKEGYSSGKNGTGCADIYLAPAAVCRHITFPVAADYVLGSTDVLRALLDSVPGSSLTVFTGVGSLGITPTTVRDIIQAFGKDRLFFDVKLSRLRSRE